MSELLTHQQVVDRLRARCGGKQVSLAVEAGVSDAHVCNVFKGVRPPGPALQRLAGVRRVVRFEVVP